VRGVHDPPWCSEPSERRHVGVVRVVRDALWVEGAARAGFGVVRLVPVDGCGGGGGGRNLWTLGTGLDLRSYPVRVGRVVDVVV
jgi:hypothetical protein